MSIVSRQQSAYKWIRRVTHSLRNIFKYVLKECPSFFHFLSIVYKVTDHSDYFIL